MNKSVLRDLDRELQLHMVIDNLPVMIAYVDRCNTYRVVNRAFHNFFGVNENELTGRHSSEVLGKSLYASVEKYIDRVLAGQSVEWEAHYQEPHSKQEQILSFKLSPYTDMDGQYNGYLVVVENISNIKRMHLELESLNHSLEKQVEFRTAQLRKELKRREKLEQELRKLADHDPLTGLLNRRAFMRQMNREINRSTRYHSDLTYMIIDIDKFKSINDSYGHMSGDMVLKSFADNISRIIRESDIVGRIGGEEFAIVLPGTNLKLANEMGERICRELAQQPIRYRNIDISYTVSIGIARFQTSHGDGMEMHALADSALYQAKNSGRNRVCVALAG